jgi:hypothetical protein
MGFLKFFALLVLGLAVGVGMTLAGFLTGDGTIGTAMVLIGWFVAAGLINYAGEQW